MREKRVNQSQKTKELKDVENLHRAEEKCRVNSNIPFQKFAKFGIKKRIACLILALKQQFFLYYYYCYSSHYKGYHYY